MKRAAAAALLLFVTPQQPRWAGLDGIALGSPVDEILARGGSCRSAETARELTPGLNLGAFAQAAFGYALPHYHEPRDSGAVRRALGVGTMCYGPAFERQAWLVAAAVDRSIVAMVVYFGGNPNDTLALPPSADSVRRVAYAAWGRPTHPSPTLDTWWGRRYRSYVLIPAYPERVSRWARSLQLILLDVSACTAFDARVHRAGARGESGAC